MPTELTNIQLTPDRNNYDLATVIAEDYKLHLPIRGGWGYGIDHPVIIDRSMGDLGIPFDGVSIEYVVVEKRIYEELIVFRPLDDRYGVIRWKLQKQRLLFHEGRAHDHLVFKVTCYHDRDIEFLRTDIAKAACPDDFDAHERMRQERECFYFTEYYFDISSFYGRG